MAENIANKDSHFNNDKTKTHLKKKKHLTSFSNKDQKIINKTTLWHNSAINYSLDY